MTHDHDVPGHEPVRIIALEDGDAPGVPHEVEAELRRLSPRRPPPRTRAELLEGFEADFIGSACDRRGCLQDWYKIHPELRRDLDLIADSIDPMVRVSLGKSDADPDYLAPRAWEPNLGPAPASTPAPAPSPPSPPPPRPTAIALGVCYVPLVLVTCLLAALRTGGAIDWDWGWVLAPVWLPLVLGTVALLVASIALAFLDERDAARRRS